MRRAKARRSTALSRGWRSTKCAKQSAMRRRYPLDRVNSAITAPRPRFYGHPDFTYVAASARFVYVTFLIDALARRIVGRRVSRTAHAGFVLDALQQTQRRSYSRRRPRPPQ